MGLNGTRLNLGKLQESRRTHTRLSLAPNKSPVRWELGIEYVIESVPWEHYESRGRLATEQPQSDHPHCHHEVHRDKADQGNRRSALPLPPNRLIASRDIRRAQGKERDAAQAPIRPPPGRRHGSGQPPIRVVYTAVESQNAPPQGKNVKRRLSHDHMATIVRIAGMRQDRLKYAKFWIIISGLNIVGQQAHPGPAQNRNDRRGSWNPKNRQRTKLQELRYKNKTDKKCKISGLNISGQPAHPGQAHNKEYRVTVLGSPKNRRAIYSRKIRYSVAV
jgi:hypothetical protein